MAPRKAAMHTSRVRRFSTFIPAARLCFALVLSSLLPSGAFAAEKPNKAASEIAELKREVEALRSENQRLRRLLVEDTERVAKTLANKIPTAPTVGEAPGTLPGSETPAVSAKHRLSNSGKRHNAQCRYFSSGGRPCGKDEGVACKVCGG